MPAKKGPVLTQQSPLPDPNTSPSLGRREHPPPLHNHGRQGSTHGSIGSNHAPGSHHGSQHGVAQPPPPNAAGSHHSGSNHGVASHHGGSNQGPPSHHGGSNMGGVSHHGGSIHGAPPSHPGSNHGGGVGVMTPTGSYPHDVQEFPPQPNHALPPPPRRHPAQPLDEYGPRRPREDPYADRR